MPIVSIRMENVLLFMSARIGMIRVRSRRILFLNILKCDVDIVLSAWLLSRLISDSALL